MRVLGFAFCVSALLVGSGLAQAQGIGWQEAVARLAGERTRAENCASLLKQYGNQAAQGRGKLTYGESKAEFDGVIAGLIVALVKDEQPPSLPDLKARLERGNDGLNKFCGQAKSLVPDTDGEKGVLDSIVSGQLDKLIEAIKEIYLDWRKEVREEDRLARITIQNQLEATKWPAFADISSSN